MYGPSGAAEDFSGLLRKQPVWMQRQIKWERAPRSVNPKLSAGPAVTLYFGADGDFRMLSGTVYKLDGTISASQGDSESIWKGKWVLNGDSIHVSFQLIYHDIRMLGEQLPGPMQEATFQFQKGGKSLKARGSTGLKLDGFEFEVNSMLSGSSVEEQIRFGGPLGHGSG
jgi:hypothetical protein